METAHSVIQKLKQNQQAMVISTLTHIIHHFINNVLLSQLNDIQIQMYIHSILVMAYQ